MKLNVPYLSQQLDVTKEEWRDRACGVTALAMILHYHLSDEMCSIDELIDEGVLIGGYGERGWIHDGLVALARNHGLSAYRQEFRSMTINVVAKTMHASDHEHDLIADGLHTIVRALESGMPVIVSVFGGFRNGGEYHIIVLTGYERDHTRGALGGFYYHEPNTSDPATGTHAYVNRETFKKYWRKMAIFIRKPEYK